MGTQEGFTPEQIPTHPMLPHEHRYIAGHVYDRDGQDIAAPGCPECLRLVLAADEIERNFLGRIKL